MDSRRGISRAGSTDVFKNAPCFLFGCFLNQMERVSAFVVRADHPRFWSYLDDEVANDLRRLRLCHVLNLKFFENETACVLVTDAGYFHNEGTGAVCCPARFGLWSW